MNFKKVASIALAGAMAMSMMAVPAFADGTDTTTTPTPTPIPTNTGKAYDVNVQNHTYNAYQIFTGTQADKNQPLGNVDWGTGVDGTSLLKALQSDKTIGIDFSSCTDAQSVANKLVDATDAQARAFAKFVYDSKTLKSSAAIALGTKSTDTITRTPNNDGTVSYSGDGIKTGYYLIEDTTDVTPGTDGKEDAKNLTVLQVANTITIKSKAQYPTIEKKILDPDEKDVNEASMGEDVQYELKSTVPDTKAYTEGYYFYMSDMQSKGLTLDENSFVVTVGDKTLAKDTDYTVTVEHSTDPADTIDYITTDAEWPTAFEINFKKIQNYTAGQAIKVTYKAELNENAAIYPEANPNQVNLYYSNNPNQKYGGKEKGKKPSEPTGVTPWDKVETYTTGVKLQKTDGTSFTGALKDAEFTLTTTGGMKYSVVTTNEFTEDDKEGTYYKLKDGTYTTTAPTTDTADKYDSTTAKYKNKTSTTTKGVGKSDTTIKATVDPLGQIQFTGLGAGTYTLEETNTPKGYNKAPNLTFTISFDNTKNPKFSSDNTDVKFSDATKLFETTIINKQGSLLPSTGGIGTRMFYVFGGCLVAAAVALLALKKRREA
ncbi:MAG: isopeptide-forming domain-containing fimbrial protein [Lachnospiraceae bacterium]|nr:isopeptide-forming domain-containing fimbrial protein [Lachnospiraceae bacterium]MCH4063510.1 isopeptide-forming domain-containing fimbrial protein [Lachnospiraceae bacterium]MCH4104658.1 isopeptide-forming domain-containing fimbrial protein [Lachnospiraceae bacterium]MCI1310063.1 isopeptide-forming domain-containing fimbrial protein [Lachnospiraceae bacterium]MCI1358629.1 isopeptide-forming domain-containing fimbrial protein [Lachnospiraceae bacterium]